MNEKIKEFLSELDKLMKKYEISSIQTVSNEPILFANDDNCVVAFSEYDDGNFENVVTTLGSYQP